MCGIVAYVGHREAVPILLDGLYKLEYRGYDSAGLSVVEHGSLVSVKKEGKVERLDKAVSTQSLSSTIGIGHTRWATHGPPSDRNAHPHISPSGQISIVHNGIIENHQVLKEALIGEGYNFSSDTDTEVVVMLVEHYKRNLGLNTEMAFRKVLHRVEGAYAIVTSDAKKNSFPPIPKTNGLLLRAA
ncbi:MAG: hypothetical protein AAFR14_09350 [Bacteroidota bacterium]